MSMTDPASLGPAALAVASMRPADVLTLPELQRAAVMDSHPAFSPSVPGRGGPLPGTVAVGPVQVGVPDPVSALSSVATGIGGALMEGLVTAVVVAAGAALVVWALIALTRNAAAATGAPDPAAVAGTAAKAAGTAAAL